MSDTPHRALFALGLCRLLDLEQKRRQRDRARKVAAYLKMSKALTSDLFRCRLRIDSSALFKLLGLIRPCLISLRVDLEEVSAEERLLVTLKYLATGYTMEQLSHDFSKPRLLATIIPETCQAIYRCLREYRMFPKTTKDWEDIASEFEEKWHFSHCAGAFVAKHIPVDEPPQKRAKCLNRKKASSIVIVAVVNANYEFTYFSSGTNSSLGCIFENSEFFTMLLTESINLPEDCPLEGTDDPMPYVFLGETYILIENIMKGYPPDQLTPERKIFNYRFSRAKRVADNAYGVLYERFGILHQKICLDEEHWDNLIMACCALHNFLIRSSKDYLNEESLDSEDLTNFKFKPASWRLKRQKGMKWKDTHPMLSLDTRPEQATDAIGALIRDSFTDYFNNIGKVPFQDQMMNVIPE